MGCRLTPVPMHRGQHHLPLARQLGHLREMQLRCGWGGGAGILSCHAQLTADQQAVPLGRLT